METPPNFRQLKHKLSKSQLIELHEQEMIDTLNKFIEMKDSVYQLRKELDQANRERDYYASLAGIKPKSKNAIYQARHRQKLKEGKKQLIDKPDK